MKIKKHSIGYNTVSSVDGIISTRGVKSKPNNIQIFGYTHEIGDGEKSPDNSYQLVGLDSGNVNLCNGWNYSNNLFTIIDNHLSVKVTNNTTQYRISTSQTIKYDKNIMYIYVKFDGTFTSGARKPQFALRFYDSTNLDLLYYPLFTFH